MTDHEFKIWYARIENTVSNYETVSERTAVIAGYFEGMLPETTFTATQVSEMLKLRNPREQRRGHETAEEINKRSEEDGLKSRIKSGRVDVSA